MTRHAKATSTRPDATVREEHPAVRAAREAPLDEEPETEEERAAVAEAWDDVRAGRVLPHAEVKRRWLAGKE